jgi:hypothetical protein
MKSNEVFAHLKVVHGDAKAWSMDRRNRRKTSQLFVRPYWKVVESHYASPALFRLIKHRMANRRKNLSIGSVPFIRVLLAKREKEHVGAFSAYTCIPCVHMIRPCRNGGTPPNLDISVCRTNNRSPEDFGIQNPWHLYGYYCDMIVRSRFPIIEHVCWVKLSRHLRTDELTDGKS